MMAVHFGFLSQTIVAIGSLGVLFQEGMYLGRLVVDFHATAPPVRPLYAHAGRSLPCAVEFSHHGCAAANLACCTMDSFGQRYYRRFGKDRESSQSLPR